MDYFDDVLGLQMNACRTVCWRKNLTFYLNLPWHQLISIPVSKANVISLDKIGGPNVTIVVDGRVVTGVRSMQKNGLQPGAGDCVVLFHGSNNSTNFGPGGGEGGRRRGQYEIRFRVHEVGKMLDFTSVIVI